MNSVFGLLSFFSATVSLFFGGYILVQSRKIKSNSIFSIICLCFAIWSFGFSMIFFLPSSEDVVLWYRFSSIGWTNIPALTLHFSLLVSEKEKKISNKWLLPAIYLPGLIFTVESVTGVGLEKSFVFANETVLGVGNMDSPFCLAFILFSTFLAAASIFILFHNAITSKSGRIRRQSIIIGISLAITAFCIYSNNIFSLIVKNAVPSIGQNSFLLAVSGICFALTKYRQVQISSSNAAELIVSQMMDMLFLLDKDLRVVKCNNLAKKITGLDEKSLIEMPFRNLLEDPSHFKKEMQILNESQNHTVIIETNFFVDDGKSIPFKISISYLMDHFNEAIGIVVVGHDIREKLELRTKKEMIDHELQLAQHIQMSIMPSSMPELSGVKFASIYTPMDMLGGDFYNFIRLREREKIGIFLSDVSGHGVPAALITGMLKALIESSGGARTKTDEFLKFINNNIYEQTDGNFITAFYAIYDADSGILQYSRAGHTIPILLNESGITMLESKGRLLGVLDSIQLESKSIKLKPGDKILFYTDGLIESFNDKKEMFAIYLNDIILANLNSNIDVMINNIYNELKVFSGGKGFADDVLMIGMEITDSTKDIAF